LFQHLFHAIKKFLNRRDIFSGPTGKRVQNLLYFAIKG
jgi:hypothetical protein